MTFLTTHWQMILMGLVAALTFTREILDLCGDTAPDGALQAIVSFLSQFTGSAPVASVPPASSSNSSTPPKA